MSTNSINFATIYILFSVIGNKLKNVKPEFNRIIIKVGSNVITQKDGLLNESRILRIVEDALSYISTYGSKHSEAIISKNINRIELFNKVVDASSVYSNTSTAFTDGAQFGLGAEIGISTQKLHARGPLAFEALTTYKWII